VTLDEGMLAFFSASFMESSPIYSSVHFARALGFSTRVVPPLVLLNFGLSFSVLDVSEQAIAHLAYIDVRFPNPSYPGETITAASEVLGTKLAGSGDRGTVHVRTTVWNQDLIPVCVFERMALIPTGTVPDTVLRPWEGPIPAEKSRFPAFLSTLNLTNEKTRSGFWGYFEDFRAGDVIVHDTGRTIGLSEHMQLTTLFRNTHPLHFDAEYCKTGSFTKDRVVYGGLVLGFTHAIASRDTGGQVVWPLSFGNGAHPNPTMAGDTIRAVQKVMSKEDIAEFYGQVTFRLIGVKNTDPETFISDGIDLFIPEREKKDGKIKEKVVEIDLTVVVRKRL